MPSCIRATRSTTAATAGAAVVMPAATVKPAGGSFSHRSAIARSIRLRRSATSIDALAQREFAANSRKSAASFASDFSQWRARSLLSATASRNCAARSPRSAAHPACGRVPPPSASLPATLPPFTIDASVSSRSVGSIAGGSTSSSIRSSAPATRSSSSGSPIGIRRGSSRPLPLCRTNASVTARTARLLGSRIRPCASPSGSSPNCAISPAASASANERCDGMVIDGDPARVRHSPAPLPSSGSIGAFQHRTTGPGAPRRKRGLPRSPGPTGCWSRTVHQARRAAGASRPSGCQ